VADEETISQEWRYDIPLKTDRNIYRYMKLEVTFLVFANKIFDLSF
jgi:hypothetical protein